MLTRFAANPEDAEAAEALRRSPEFVGTTRTTCVATMLEAGHAQNALPQRASRWSIAGSSPACRSETVRQALVGVDRQRGGPRSRRWAIRRSARSPSRAPRSTRRSPARSMPAIPASRSAPYLESGGTDGLIYRSAGIPDLGELGHLHPARRDVRPRPQRAHPGGELLRRRSSISTISRWRSAAGEARCSPSCCAALLAGGARAGPPTTSSIRGGTIYDGSGGAPFVGDVAIEGDRIAAIAPRIAARGAREIDARGLAVAPGFINMLSWATESLIQDGRGQSDIRQGVTLEVMGEGWSMGPLNAAMRRLRARAAERHPLPDPLDDAGRLSRASRAARHRPQRRELRRRDDGPHPRARRGRRRSRPGAARADAGAGPPGDERGRDGGRQLADLRARPASPRPTSWSRW